MTYAPLDAPPPIPTETPREWRVSMHGGHSREGSTHGSSTLKEMLNAAGGARDALGFEYVVGAVHVVDEMPIKVSRELFDQASRLGGLERLLLRYYRQIAGMVERLRPEVKGHFDLPRLLSEGDPAHEARSVLQRATQRLK